MSKLDLMGDRARQRRIEKRETLREEARQRQKEEDKRAREHYDKYYGGNQDSRLKKTIPQSNHEARVYKEKRRPTRKKEEPKVRTPRRKRAKGFTPRRQRSSRASENDHRGSTSSAYDKRGSRASAYDKRGSRASAYDKRGSRASDLDYGGDFNLKRQAKSPQVLETLEEVSLTKRDQGRGLEDDSFDAKSRFRKRTWTQAKRESNLESKEIVFEESFSHWEFLGDQVALKRLQSLQNEKTKRDSANILNRKTSEPGPSTTYRKRVDERRTDERRTPWHLTSKGPRKPESTATKRSNRLDEMKKHLDRQQRILDEQRKMKMCGDWQYEVQGIKSQYMIQIDEEGNLNFHENLKNVGDVNETLLSSDGWYSLYSRKLKFYIRLKLLGNEMLSQFRTKANKTWSQDIYAKRVGTVYE